MSRSTNMEGYAIAKLINVQVATRGACHVIAAESVFGKPTFRTSFERNENRVRPSYALINLAGTSRRPIHALKKEF